MDIKILRNLLQETIDQGNLRDRHHQVIQKRIMAKEDRSGRPHKGTDLFEASDHHYHEQFMESFSSANYSKWDDDRAWSSQEWKIEIKTYDRLVRPDKTSFENGTKCSTWSRGNSSRRNRAIRKERRNTS